MNKKVTDINCFNSVAKFLEMLGVTQDELQTAIAFGYRRYKVFKNGKFRYIEQPNDKLKTISQKLLKFLQNNLDCPPYCMAGFKGQNNIKNALRHKNKREVITMDIAHYFPSTKAKYIRQFFEDTFEANEEVLELLVKLTTYNDYLPTGAPTSSLLSCFTHKEIFDQIYTKMKACETDMTTFVDDITLSTNKHIGNWVISYINNLLKSHRLHLKKSKIKRFGYKYAVVTGVYIAQDGTLSTPFKMCYSVIETLKAKELTQMSKKELQKLIAKIAYIRLLQPNKFKTTQSNAIKLLKKLQKNDVNKLVA